MKNGIPSIILLMHLSLVQAATFPPPPDPTSAFLIPEFNMFHIPAAHGGGVRESWDFIFKVIDASASEYDSSKSSNCYATYPAWDATKLIPYPTAAKVGTCNNGHYSWWFAEYRNMTDFALHVRRGGEFMKEGTSGCITDSKYGEVKCDSESKCHWVFENEFMPISAPFDLSS